MAVNKKYLATGLAASAAFFIGLLHHEGFRSKPYKDGGGVATIGIGSTKYEDGTRVNMTDKPISKERAIEISRAHVRKDEARFKKSLGETPISQIEYDVYLDFIYQYGILTWEKSSIRRNLLKGDYQAACRSLLKYKYVAGKDCSVRKNRCYGVWTRQVNRYNQCMEANR